MNGNPPAKTPAISPSQAAYRLLDRNALYERLDAFPGPAVWISAPGGYGKTSLAKGYLGNRGYCIVWHQAGPADADLASFFVFLSRASCRAFSGVHPLPEPTPDSLLNLPVFARNYAETLFGRLPIPFALVLDDFHDIPADCPAHSLLACAIDRLPAGGRIVFLSRQPPPPPFARHLANSSMILLETDDLRLDLQEAQALASLHGIAEPQVAEQAHRQVEGWAAGLVLMLRHGRCDAGAPAYGSSEAIFDYFLNEILAHADARLHDFLLKSAFLPSMTVAIAARQTGSAAAGDILAQLHRENFFTARSADAEPSYTYHPLFRDFLQRRADRSLPPEAIVQLQKRAAMLLEESDHPDAAARLWHAAGNPGEIARMICRHGPQLLAQGRIRTLQGWLGLLPEDRIETDPWLLLWLGATSMVTDPAASRAPLAHALALFRERNDWAGAVRACAGALESFFFEMGDFAGTVPWIDALEELLADAPQVIPPEIELRIAGALKSVLFGNPSHPILLPWISRARRLVSTLPDPADRLAAAVAPAIHALWHGPSDGGLVFEEGRRCAELPGIPVMLRLVWSAFESIYRIFRGETQDARALLERALASAMEHGLHAFDPLLNKYLIYVALSSGNADLADAAISRAKACLDVKSRTDLMHYFYVRSQTALLRGNLTEARACVGTHLSATPDSSMLFGVAIVHIDSAGVYVESGEYAAAEAQLLKAECIARRIRTGMLPPQLDLVRAHMAIRRGLLADAAGPLRRALAVMRAYGYAVWNPTMRPQLASILAGAALELDIEREFVLDVIRSRRLRPEYTAGEHWPWPVRMETLGRFAICIDGTPLAKTGKAQKKTLDMLKTLIAHGGEQVPMTVLADALWPDAEGDAAENTVKTTLHRLRRLLGHDDALLVHEGRLSLNPSLCRVDAFAFRREADDALARLRSWPGHDAGAGIAAAESALGRYQGHFLPNETELPSLAALRESLRSRFLRLALAAGALRESRGDLLPAADIYRRCLEIDPLAESLYRQLIVCLGRSGRNAEAVATFYRCREILAIHLGTEPSAATRAAAEAGLPRP